MRPDVPLILHIAGAATLVGVSIVVVWALAGAARSSDGTVTASLTRFGFRTLLIVGLPAYIVMRVAAQIVFDEENINDLPEEPTWVLIGFIVSELGLLALVVTAVLTGVASRRLRADPGAGAGLVRAGAAITAVLLVLYLVAAWAMTGKPG
jgi:uncharacterized protein YceK